MQELFSNFYDILMNFIDNLGIFGPILGSFLIVIESIIPVLPLFVFITLNFVSFGAIIGFIVAWICTIIGCMLSYYLVRTLFKEKVENRFKDDGKLKKCINYFNNLSLTKITVILTIPFTPAFLMNIAAGLTNMSYKKYLVSLIISKFFLVYFWGVVGTSLVESFRSPKSLITVALMIIIAYIMSIIIKKVFKLE